MNDDVCIECGELQPRDEPGDICRHCEELLDEDGELDISYLDDVSRLLSDAHLNETATRVRKFRILLEADRDEQ